MKNRESSSNFFVKFESKNFFVAKEKIDQRLAGGQKNSFHTFLKKCANPGLLLSNFCPFLITISIIQIEKSVDGVLGIQTCGCMMMVGAGKTPELWQPPTHFILKLFRT